MQTITHSAHLFNVELFDLVRGVAALYLWPKCPTLDGFAQDGCWFAGSQIVCGSFVGGIQLAIVVTATWQVDQLFVGEMSHHLAKTWIWTKEVFANVCAAFNR